MWSENHRRRDAVKNKQLLSLTSMNSIAISENLELIPYDNRRPIRQSSRNFESIRSQTTIREDSSAPSRKKSQLLGHKFHSDMKSVHLFTGRVKTRTEAGFELGSSKPYQGFDPDFILCRVFGYQNIYINTSQGIFEIFEPVKVKDQHLVGYTEYEEDILHGYKSDSDY